VFDARPKSDVLWLIDLKRLVLLQVVLKHLRSEFAKEDI
jgi:hypothetical protein